MANENIIRQAQANRQKASALLVLCDRAQKLLYSAQRQLSRARNWGIIDMLGGGFITNMIKHSKLDNAMHYVNQARPLLKEIGRELKAASLQYSPELELGSFAVFADFFFDGIFADMYVQSKIKDLQWQIDDTLGQLEQVDDALRNVENYETERIRRENGSI